MQLNPNTLLQSVKYRIIRVLGQGGFGITYLAENLLLDKKVAIKEFFPKEYCDRDSTSRLTLGTQNNAETVAKLKDRFLKEAKNIAKLDHPGIVKIHDVFEENNTAYYVMDYIEGENLNEMVKRTGPLSEAKAIEYIRKVGDALDYIHSRNMTHFDVKPANIVVRREDDQPILIDFGLSKQYDIHGDATSTLMQGVSNGYSPIEFYNTGSITSFSPQSDVYSLGATLFYLLSGSIPPSATQMFEDELDFPECVSKTIICAVSRAMNVSRSKRYDSVYSFIGSLDLTDNADVRVKSDNNEQNISTFVPDDTRVIQASQDVNDDAPEPEIDEDWKSNGYIKYVLGICLVLIIGIGIYYFADNSTETITRTTVQDPDNILTEKEAESLSKFNDEINSTFDVCLVSLIVCDAKVEDFKKQFADSIFNAWGIGDKDTNRGLLIAIDVENRALAITTGLGLETTFPNDSCYAIIQKMIPFCRVGDFYEALKSGSLEVKRVLELNTSKHDLLADPVPVNENYLVNDNEEILGPRNSNLVKKQ